MMVLLPPPLLPSLQLTAQITSPLQLELLHCRTHGCWKVVTSVTTPANQFKREVTSYRVEAVDTWHACTAALSRQASCAEGGLSRYWRAFNLP